jgi:hypothetical protein
MVKFERRYEKATWAFAQVPLRQALCLRGTPIAGTLQAAHFGGWFPLSTGAARVKRCIRLIAWRSVSRREIDVNRQMTCPYFPSPNRAKLSPGRKGQVRSASVALKCYADLSLGGVLELFPYLRVKRARRLALCGLANSESANDASPFPRILVAGGCVTHETLIRYEQVSFSIADCS